MQILKLAIIAPFFLLTPHFTITKAVKPVTPVVPTKAAPVPAPQPTPPTPAPEPPPPAPPIPAAPQSFPVSPIGTYANTYAFGNCTWYVAGRKNIPNTWGNAATWGERAAADGITVSATPLIGAIAQRSGGLGHVAIVEDVSDGRVLITEMNSLGFDVVDERWMPLSTYNYIYV